MRFCTLFYLCTAIVCFCAVPADADDLLVQSFYGHDGLVSPARWNPLTLRITNQGDVFDGTIVVHTLLEPADDTSETAFTERRKIRIGRDGSVTLRFVVPIGRTVLPVTVRAVTNETVVGSWRVGALSRPQAGFVVGITDSLPVDGRGRRIAYPLIETLPDHPVAYESADALVLGDPNLARAESGQVAALRHRLATNASFGIPVVAGDRQDETVARVLFAEPIYRYPPRWIVALAFLAYLAAMATAARSFALAACVALPPLFALLIFLVFGVVDKPPRTAIAEIQRVDAVAGEEGATVIREIRVMSVGSRHFSLRVPPFAVAIPQRGETLLVESGSGTATLNNTVGPWGTRAFALGEKTEAPLRLLNESRVLRVQNTGRAQLNNVAVLNNRGVRPLGTLGPGKSIPIEGTSGELTALASALYDEMARTPAYSRRTVVAMTEAILPPVKADQPIDRTVNRTIILLHIRDEESP